MRLSKLLKICTLLTVYCLLFTVHCKAQTLSPAARVSVLTVGPGAELYSSFGHTVLRIQDPALGLDRPYSYGTFDFRTENFYLKFIRGTLPYTLSVSDLGRELQYWQYENRSVAEQVLRLSARQKQRLFDALETNYRPENREYPYKFYFDNCTSRIRDQLAQACADSLTFADKDKPTGQSYRDAMNTYLQRKDLDRFGMNLALGRPSDVEMTVWQSMYLPENLMAQLRRATIRQADGRVVPVVLQEQALGVARPGRDKTPGAYRDFFRNPYAFALSPGLMVLLNLLLRTFRRPWQPTAWADRLIFSVYGLAGWFLLLLWIGTDHGVTNWNLALLLFFPAYFPFVFRATRPGNVVASTAFFRASWGLLLLSMLVPAGFVIYDRLTFAPAKILFGPDSIPGYYDCLVYAILVTILAIRLNLRYPLTRFFNRTRPA